MKWHIGCSGFSYKEWKGVFYPDKLAQSKWLAYYCEHFNTLELNNTFYRFPLLKTMKDWHNKTPENFSFAVKAPRIITHYKQLVDTQDLIKEFYAVCKEGLNNKLGPVLFQFPPRFLYTPENLQKILISLDSAFINVVEFRHSSWWCEEVYTQLAKKNIIFCGVNHPSLPNDVVINNSIVYYRLHGAPKLFLSEYNEETLETIANKIFDNNRIKNVYCYFNNTMTVSAIKNAQWLQQYSMMNKVY
ncbi:MAG TPA: DUF72 domain-containing protein [Ferruginibacter sp.]|nr:DUF72 domain-containing protein [Ferruginibacter sp.]